ncbi:hypothetical protein [Gemelliphila palaticanis]|uniref:Uncharacterized protein n=1 Tax=Gemelliphila palaticanis TaxID=81950 RepID=A0ABX2T137_9BACL|nr:hypothetical protein [Gemella palaticanis]MBF0715199.1 hypothetical protein [Gemella palaticanis]NYS47129.1 hypothetical protein [Gemella palaticanis]
MKWKNIFSDKKDDENIEIEYYSKDKREQNSDSKLTKIKNWFTANDSYTEDDLEFEDELYSDDVVENYNNSKKDYKDNKNNYKNSKNDEDFDIAEYDFEDLEIEYTDELKSNNTVDKNADSKMAKFKNLFTSKNKYEEELDFYEEDKYDIEDDTHSSKSSKFKNLFTSKNKYEEELDFDEEYEYDIEDDTHTSKSSKFKNLFTSKNKHEEELDFDKEDEETISKNTSFSKKQDKENNNGSFLDKIKNIFKTEEFESYEEKENKVYSEDEDDKPEDYKTYLEKQKNKEKNVAKENLEIHEENFEELDIEVYDEDYSDFEEEKESKLSIFKNLKEKFVSKNNSKIDNSEIDELDLDSSNEDEVETLELYNIENTEKLEEKTIEQELEIIEENSLEDEEKENKNIMKTLHSLGIDANEIKDVDVFEERENKRTHPTLASMKVKRILQEQNIDNLSAKLVFEDSKEKFSKEVIDKEDDTIEYEEITYDNHNSKNKEQRYNLDNDFNNIERKADKISVSENYIHKKDDTKLDNAINEIKETKEQSKKDNKNYDIVFNDNDTEIERREKIKYTSVDDVLKDNEEFLEDDIDRVAKKLIVPREKELESDSEELKNFREDILNSDNKKYSNVELDPKKQTNLDKLIIDSKILDKENDNSSKEIEKLEENLEKIIDDNNIKTYENTIQKEDNLSHKKTSLDGYSDYHLDLEEIEELAIQNKIESKSENTNIDSLNKSFGKKATINNDIDRFKEEKMYTPPLKNINKDLEVKKEYNNDYKKEKIEYTEKLYTNEVGDYFVDDNSPLTFGEYKTQDRGYRPVSKEIIENNQKKLDAIFEKYSHTSINKKISNTSPIEHKITTPVRNVGKFKPSVVYSSVYGAKNNSSSKEENKKSKEKIATKSKANSKNLFKEIASQDEAVWNIEINSRVPKNKKSAKK